jgi:gamma-glutamylcyclotransferase (GGCT)/AIG2-like uncharacterized protein YtfP
MNTGAFEKAPAVLTNHRMFVVSWFPGVQGFQGKNQTHCVSGQILRGISDEQLATLDTYEGYPTLYTRPKVRVTLEDGTEEECWVYLFNEKHEWPEDEKESGGNSVTCEEQDGSIIWNFHV